MTWTTLYAIGFVVVAILATTAHIVLYEINKTYINYLDCLSVDDEMGHWCLVIVAVICYPLVVPMLIAFGLGVLFYIHWKKFLLSVLARNDIFKKEED